ncbi:CHAT domain-containing protein [Synechococcus sp. PCC 7335]|uniref:CHAT domain-containing protein n=1 Tax=Synechococcus sp. (strain ATCC 29403 / PCC 7335) TaxID=91464 RepID=UPI0002E83009|nr:CHAT domain-containing protein [Synechococcus sp. PCC 7335]
MPTVTQTPLAASDVEFQSQISQVQELQSLGFYRRALLQLSDIDLLEQPDSLIKVHGLHLLSDLQRIVGDLTAAQTTIESAIATAQTLDVIEIAPMLLSLGHIAAASGETEQALEQYEEVSAIASTPQLKLRSHLSQLPLLTETNYSQIATLYTDIQTLIERLPVDKTTVNARLELARYYLESPIGNDIATPQVIAQNLATARNQAQTLSDSYAESYALGYLGELYLKQQQLSEADDVLRQALEIAEALRSSELTYQWQWALGRVHVQQNRTALALSDYENAVDSLKTLRGNLIAIAPDLRFDFTERVEPVYREWVALLLSSQSAKKSAEEPAKDLTNLQKAQGAIESLQLAELENYFAEPCVPLSQDISQIIENTTSPTAVLYPIILSNRLEILLKLPDQSLQQYTVAITQPALEELLNQFQIDLRLPFTSNTLRTLSAQLYDLLIRPAQPALEQSNIDTLVFVLDGSLRNVPMSALYDGQQYLVENYSIALAPGLQLVAPQPLANRNLTTLVAGLSEARHGFSNLPFVKAEISQVQQTTSSRVLLDEDFTEAQLTTLLSNADYQVVHLATHGQFSSDAEDTFILAWDKPIQVDDFNTLLRQSDQTNESAIELLILSACDTALGDRRAALGIAGVAVQAGARSTLATLWNLDDETGALFSNYFYQALQQPDTSKAQALRLAQLQILKGEDANSQLYQHPRFWAPYILLGNWL